MQLPLYLARSSVGERLQLLRGGSGYCVERHEGGHAEYVAQLCQLKGKSAAPAEHWQLKPGVFPPLCSHSFQSVLLCNEKWLKRSEPDGDDEPSFLF